MRSAFYVFIIIISLIEFGIATNAILEIYDQDGDDLALLFAYPLALAAPLIALGAAISVIRGPKNIFALMVLVAHLLLSGLAIWALIMSSRPGFQY